MRPSLTAIPLAMMSRPSWLRSRPGESILSGISMTPDSHLVPAVRECHVAMGANANIGGLVPRAFEKVERVFFSVGCLF